MPHPPAFKPFKTASRCLLVALASCLMACLTACAVVAPGELDNPGDPGDATARSIRLSMYGLNAVGLSACVVKDDRVTWSGQFGRADKEAGTYVTEDTLFHIGSISKTVTGVAIMQLVERGLIGLDQDVNDFLDFPLRNPRYPATPITFRHLLYHGSSVVRDKNDLYNVYAGTTGKIMPLADLIEPAFDPARNADVADMYLEWAPGSNALYSNWGFAILGYLVERASGQLFEEFVQANIFDPLGMDSASWFASPANASMIAASYGPDREAFTETKIAMYSAGSLLCSQRDFARFLAVFTNGGTVDGERILSSESVTAMAEVQLNGYGLALERLAADVDGLAPPVIGKGGDLFGSHANFLFDPVKRIGFFWCCTGYFMRPRDYFEIDLALWREALEE
jgi:CubicO group peptidase (beta-lactamase class C family)